LPLGDQYGVLDRWVRVPGPLGHRSGHPMGSPPVKTEGRRNPGRAAVSLCAASLPPPLRYGTLNHRGQRLGVSEGAPHPPPSRPAVAAWRAMVPDPVQYLIADVNNHTHARTRRTHPRPAAVSPFAIWCIRGSGAWGSAPSTARRSPRPTASNSSRASTAQGVRSGGTIPCLGVGIQLVCVAIDMRGIVRYARLTADGRECQ